MTGWTEALRAEVRAVAALHGSASRMWVALGLPYVVMRSSQVTVDTGDSDSWIAQAGKLVVGARKPWRSELGEEQARLTWGPGDYADWASWIVLASLTPEPAPPVWSLRELPDHHLALASTLLSVGVVWVRQ